METIILNENNTEELTAEQFAAKAAALTGDASLMEDESEMFDLSIFDELENGDWGVEEQVVEEEVVTEKDLLMNLVKEVVAKKKQYALDMASKWASKQYKTSDRTVWVNTHSEYEMKETNVSSINERRKRRNIKNYELLAVECDEIIEWFNEEGAEKLLAGKSLDYLTGVYGEVLEAINTVK